MSTPIDMTIATEAAEAILRRIIKQANSDSYRGTTKSLAKAYASVAGNVHSGTPKAAVRIR